MKEPEKDYSRRYEELMRKAGDQRRKFAAGAIEAERRFQREMQLRKERGGSPQDDEVRLLLARLDIEICSIKARLEFTTDQQERIMLKSELAHLWAAQEHFRSGKHRRRPPESGIPVPAVPPRGPLPKLGGAEVPLEFD